jgi:hypothetical protein
LIRFGESAGVHTGAQFDDCASTSNARPLDAAKPASRLLRLVALVSILVESTTMDSSCAAPYGVKSRILTITSQQSSG